MKFSPIKSMLLVCLTIGLTGSALADNGWWPSWEGAKSKLASYWPGTQQPVEQPVAQLPAAQPYVRPEIPSSPAATSVGIPQEVSSPLLSPELQRFKEGLVTKSASESLQKLLDCEGAIAAAKAAEEANSRLKGEIEEASRRLKGEAEASKQMKSEYESKLHKVEEQLARAEDSLRFADSVALEKFLSTSNEMFNKGKLTRSQMLSAKLALLLIKKELAQEIYGNKSLVAEIENEIKFIKSEMASEGKGVAQKIAATSSYRESSLEPFMGRQFLSENPGSLQYQYEDWKQRVPKSSAQMMVPTTIQVSVPGGEQLLSQYGYEPISEVPYSITAKDIPSKPNLIDAFLYSHSTPQESQEHEYPVDKPYAASQSEQFVDQPMSQQPGDEE